MKFRTDGVFDQGGEYGDFKFIPGSHWSKNKAKSNWWEPTHPRVYITRDEIINHIHHIIHHTSNPQPTSISSPAFRFGAGCGSKMAAELTKPSIKQALVHITYYTPYQTMHLSISGD